MIGQRSVWMAARARNAARQGVWIAAFGGLAVVVTLLALVMIPREADRQVRRRIAALPAVPDSLPLVRQRDSLRAAHDALQRVADSVLLAQSDSTGIEALLRDAAVRDSLTRAALIREGLPADSAARTSDPVTDLALRLRRARQLPLLDSYRALAAARMLAGDTRAAALLDSIDEVARERDGVAAIGGPDARYAAQSARLTALGQSLVRIAERRLADAVFSSRDGAVIAGSEADSTPSDSVQRDQLSRRTAAVESTLVSVRQRLHARDTQRLQLEARLNVSTPPIAMLLAALVIGLAVGYGVVLTRELRRPSVGDIAEVERLTRAAVLLHSREALSTLVERRPLRERPGVPRIIDRDSDTFALLHLALTGVGDVVSQVDIVADAPVIGAAVALGTAAAAARESRAVLVVEASRRQPLLAHVLNAKVRHTADDVRTGRVSPEEAVHVVTLDRDAHIDVLLAETPPIRTGLFERRRASTVPPVRRPRSEPSADERSSDGSIDDLMRRFEARYDLRLHLPDVEHDDWPAARDVIICARQGATSLAWLTRVTQHTRSRQQRVRAVVVWSRDVPTV